jgi:hypothetical protein
MKPAPLEHLRIVSETATYLEVAPKSAAARRRRDESVLRALRDHPPRAVAEAARISAAQLFEIVAASVPEPSRRPVGAAGHRRPQAFAGSFTSVRRMLFPEGSRKPESMP